MLGIVAPRMTYWSKRTIMLCLLDDTPRICRETRLIHRYLLFVDLN